MLKIISIIAINCDNKIILLIINIYWGGGSLILVRGKKHIILVYSHLWEFLKP
jgi:hypothetical protein